MVTYITKREIAAYHEAGHVVIAALYGKIDYVEISRTTFAGSMGCLSRKYSPHNFAVDYAGDLAVSYFLKVIGEANLKLPCGALQDYVDAELRLKEFTKMGIEVNVQEIFVLTKKYIIKYWPVIYAVGRELMKKGRLSGDEVKAIFELKKNEIGKEDLPPLGIPYPAETQA